MSDIIHGVECYDAWRNEADCPHEIVDAMERYKAALREISDVEPIPVGSKLSVIEWADALERAQRIAVDALESGDAA